MKTYLLISFIAHNSSNGLRNDTLKKYVQSTDENWQYTHMSLFANS